MKRIYIPTARDDQEGYDNLFELSNIVNGIEDSIVFDFSRCAMLHHNGAAFVGGLTRTVEKRNYRVDFDWRTLHNQVKARLYQNQFLENFNPSGFIGPLGHNIPFREEKEQDKVGQIEYLKQEWLGRGWINISPPLKAAIVGTVWELFTNAFEHGKSEAGLFLCGKHDEANVLSPNIQLTAVDFGKGIPTNVNGHLKKNLADGEALRWAFKRGNSTRETDLVKGGLGLDLLKEFIKINSGKLEVYSQKGYVDIEKDKEIYESREINFQGTLVNITLTCDEDLYYKFADEEIEGPLF